MKVKQICTVCEKVFKQDLKPFGNTSVCDECKTPSCFVCGSKSHTGTQHYNDIMKGELTIR